MAYNNNSNSGKTAVLALVFVAVSWQACIGKQLSFVVVVIVVDICTCRACFVFALAFHKCVGVWRRVAATSVVACTILAIFVFVLRSLKKCCCRCWKKSIEPDRQKNVSVANENANKKHLQQK